MQFVKLQHGKRFFELHCSASEVASAVQCATAIEIRQVEMPA